MTEYGRFVAGVDYTQANFAEVLHRTLGDGVLSGVANMLRVTANSPVGMSVLVDTGEAFGRGYWYQNDASKAMTISASDPTNPRIDRVVVRFNLASATPPALAVLTGTPAVSPTAPSLTQSSSTWEISLAQVLVSAGVASIALGKVTDERYQPSLCGLAANVPMFDERENKLTNPGFEIWQRGTSFTSDNVYTADRWVEDWGAGSSGTTTQESSTVGGQSRYALKTVYTHSAASLIYQKLEDYFGLRNRPISFSMLVNCSVASGARLYISDGTTTTYSAYHSGSAQYELLTVTATPASTATVITVGVSLGVSCTVYLDNAVLVPGSTPMLYLPLHPAEDLARCQRYYSLPIDGVVAMAAWDQIMTAGGQIPGWMVWYPTSTYGTPTATKNGTWTTANTTGQPTLGGVNRNHLTIKATASAAGTAIFYTDSSDDTISIESNP